MTVVLIKCKVWNENFYTGKVYIFEKYSLTVSNDISREAKSELCQKIPNVYEFPGTYLIGNIFIITNATTVKKYFLDLLWKRNQLVYVVKDNF